MTIDIRLLRAADRQAAHHLGSQAFSARPVPYDPDRPAMPDDQRLGAFDGDRLVGHCGVWAMHQWFGGRAVPMGGVGGVAVAPDHRGTGIAAALLRHALELMSSRGDAVSVLFPATVPPYRAAGWELAGSWLRRTVPAASLADLPRPDDTTVRPATDDDLPAMVACYDHLAPAHNGMIGRPAPLTQRLLGDSEGRFRYVACRADEIVGYVVYTHTPGSDDDRGFYRIRVSELVGVDGDAELALLRLLGSHRSVVDTVELVVGPADPLLLHLDEDDLRAPPRTWHWMARLVDASAAVAARGYPMGVTARCDLTIDDPLRPDNAGAHVLEVGGGVGRLVPGGSGRVRCTIGTLATLFTGWANPADLRRHGRLSGASDDDVAALARTFAGPPPWLRTFF